MTCTSSVSTRVRLASWTGSSGWKTGARARRWADPKCLAIERLAAAGSIPVINALTDYLHPCQIYTDAFTMAERWASPGGDLLASLKGRKIAFLGDTACNMANSWILGAGLFGMHVALSGPAEFEPGTEIKAQATAEGFTNAYSFTTDPFEAVKDADVVYTDVWVSMGKEEETKQRLAQMTPYQVTESLLAAAKSTACSGR